MGGFSKSIIYSYRKDTKKMYTYQKMNGYIKKQVQMQT